MCLGIRVLKHLKEELALAIDKWLQVISNICNVSYTIKKLNNKVVLNLNQFCMHCYVALSNIF